MHKINRFSGHRLRGVSDIRVSLPRGVGRLEHSTATTFCCAMAMVASVASHADLLLRARFYDTNTGTSSALPSLGHEGSYHAGPTREHAASFLSVLGLTAFATSRNEGALDKNMYINSACVTRKYSFSHPMMCNEKSWASL